jgi:uncharacterized protein (DUF1684 family)
VNARETLDLLDWKRRIFELYGEVRAGEGSVAAWQRWREVRDDLFRTHPQSPVPPGKRSGLAGVPCFDHDPALRTAAAVEDAEPERFVIGRSAGATFEMTRFAVARFQLLGAERSLELFWLEGYGGGLFLPFRDATSGAETYGAGRYLLDTVKGADLGGDGEGRLILDFNFAYHPSCRWDPQWACPLAPPSNRLDVAVRGGERL